MANTTAGRAIGEQELRAYTYCPELWFLGGNRIDAHPAGQLAKHALEHMLSDSLRTQVDVRHRMGHYVGAALKTLDDKSNFLAGQVEGWQSRATLWLDEFFQLFSPDIYMPVTGPLPWRVQVGKSSVDITLSGVLRTKKHQTLHILYFTPYTTTLDKNNDPVIPLILSSMKDLVAKGVGKNPRPQVRLHLLSFQDGQPYLQYNSIDSNQLDSSSVSRPTAIVRSMEAGNHWPSLPCRWAACPKRSACAARKE